MSKADQQRVFNVAPEGVASIEHQIEETIHSDLSSISSSQSPEEVIFLTHILSLKTAALIHLGVISEVGESIDLETAKQIIDTLEVLNKRTSGNLSYEEEQLLNTVTQELKIAYLSAKK